MNLNPLIPNATTTHDVAHILSESFEDTLKECISSNIADNLRKNKLDDDYQIFKKYAIDIKQFSDDALEEYAAMQSLEADMMIKQGQNMILEKKLEDQPCLRDNMLLRRHGYFESYPFSTKRYHLIDKRDILPSKMEQVLDFTYGQSAHDCRRENCMKTKMKPVNIQPVIIHKIELENCDMKISPIREENVKEPIKIDPKEIVFNDFELNTVYKRKVRVQNCTSRKRNFFFAYPKKSPITLKVLSDKDFLAPGMYVDILVSYCAEVYHNYSTEIKFFTAGGYHTTLKISSFRKPPHLRVYIFRSRKFFKPKKTPNNCEFWEERCTALNDTIDCGHCFIGDYNYLSLIIGNVGTGGQFFFLTEEEWLSGDINSIDRKMQFTKDCFLIFPIFISINQNEIAEVCVTFKPNIPGLHAEKLYLVSDNNTVKPVEILGDGLYFTKNMIQVFFKKSRQFEKVKQIGILDDEDVEELPSRHALQMDYIANLSSNTIIFQVNNKSAMYLNFYWTFRNKEDDKTTFHLDPKCVTINLNHDYLSPYSRYNFQVAIVPDVEKEGHYSIMLGFHVAKIPQRALEDGEEFTIHHEMEFDGIQYCDVQVCEIEIGCEIYFEKEKPPELPLPKICDCPKPPSDTDRKLIFSTPLMDFGVIPIGVDLERKFDILKLKGKNVRWFLAEVIYDADKKPSMYIAEKPNTSKTCGTLSGKKCTLKYFINAKKPKRRVSMLLLFTGKMDDTLRLNSTCIITYEVIKWKIKIYSEESKRPIVSSSKLHYLGIMCRWKFFIKNYSPLTACFWLFPPKGEDVEKLEMKFHPMNGIIRPGEKVTVNITAIPMDVGMIENVYVPCFYSKNCDPIIIRFICVVDDINVYFYIPSQSEGYDKILWPPKVLHDVEFKEAEPIEMVGEGYNFPFNWGSLEQAPSNISSVYTDIMPRIESSEESISSETLGSSKICGRSVYSHMSSSSYIISLAEYLNEHYKGEFIKQDYTVEVRNVTLKKPQQISFYIENITPIYADFAVDATNFAPLCDGASEYSWRTTTTMDIAVAAWDESCKKHGIIVVPDPNLGALEANEVIQVTVWIYATTWGIYTEEIVVKINEINSFAFYLLIEVNGAPIEFPIARKTIRQYPTMRFAPISYASEPLTQILKFKNTSSISLSIQWFLFNSSNEPGEHQYFNTIMDMVDKNRKSSEEEIHLFLSKRYYGQQDSLFLKVDPKGVQILPGEFSEVQIKLDPSYFPLNFEGSEIRGRLVGYVYISDSDKCQKNLVYRKSGEELKPIYVEIIANLVKPILSLDLQSGDTTVKINATQIIDGTNEDELITLTFKNNNPMTSTVSFHIEAPFKIVNILMRDHICLENINNAIVKAGDVVVVQLKCLPTIESVIEMANWIFRSTTFTEKVCIATKRIKIKRHLNIHLPGVQGQSLPLICEIQYPRIHVKPIFLKFQHVNINTTKRMCLSLYNSNDIEIKFEIHQAAQLPEFVIEPIEGVLQPAFGPNNSSFTEICIHFTPTLCQYYQESIIIQTIISQCLLIVPLNGYGVQNEKFSTNIALK